jgi:hypothetical protein
MQATGARVLLVLGALGLTTSASGVGVAAADQPPRTSPLASVDAPGAEPPQPEPAAPTAPALPAAPVSAAPGVVAIVVRRESGSVDPAGALNAAFTQPAGSWTYNGSTGYSGPFGYSSFGLSGVFANTLIYGLNDSVQASFTLQPLLTDNSYVRGTVALKAGVRTGAKSSLSAEVAFNMLRRHSGAFSNEDRPWIKVPAATVFATACLSDSCSSHFSAHVRYAVATDGESATAQEFNYGISLLKRLGAHVKLVLDLAAARYKYGGAFEELPGFGLTYGLRFFAADFAADIGLFKPMDAGANGDGIHFGLPSAAVTYRWR